MNHGASKHPGQLHFLLRGKTTGFIVDDFDGLLPEAYLSLGTHSTFK